MINSQKAKFAPLNWIFTSKIFECKQTYLEFPLTVFQLQSEYYISEESTNITC